MDLMSNNLVGLAGGKAPEPWQGRQSWGGEDDDDAASCETSGVPCVPSAAEAGPANPQKSQYRNPNPPTRMLLLFDADDFDGVPPPEDDDDDDFGDFETVDTKAAPAQPAAPVQPALADLISIDFGAPGPQPSLSNFSSTASTASQTRKPPPTPLQSTLSLNTPSLNPSPLEKSPTPVTAWPGAQSATDKDDWDAFADFPPDASTTTSANPSAVSSSWDWDAVDNTPQPAPPRRTSKTSGPRKASANEEVIGPPPTNVPPPSILLSLFPELLEEADVRLYKPTANQTPAVKSRVYADPATLDYLRGYLVLSTVAARVLAGRKHRWHRDKFLSQGMSISAAGSKGGMKLAGIDKTQAAREDREAADVVGVWRDHVGKLKSAVAAANIGIQKQVVKMEPLKVPEINDHMAVTTAKVVPTAPKACCVCGLKRDERVKGGGFRRRG
ncbi:hypothetical protein OPQ81_000076 [Rhizoctonia solani]|nr:hypothetical protein OPQ81_000076 [Rhizoctonia solani]